MSRKKQQHLAAGSAAGRVDGAVTGLLRAAFQRTSASTELRERLISTTLNILSEPRSADGLARFDEPAATNRPNRLAETRSDAFIDRPESSHRRNSLAGAPASDVDIDRVEAGEETAAFRLHTRRRSMRSEA